METEDKFKLSPIWEECLSIYSEVARICDAHGLMYYVSDGTLIGAARHKGFIPWDDDFDISMPRPDYEKFKQYAKGELPGHLKFVNWENAKEFTLIFGKIQDTREDHILELEKRVGFKLSSGLFIDIFPIDGYPRGWVECLWVRLYSFVLRSMARFKFLPVSREKAKGRLVWIAGGVFSVLLPWLRTQRQIVSRLDKLARIRSYEDAKWVGRTCSAASVFRRPPLEKTAWDGMTKLEFCGRMVAAPIEWDKCLRHEYGDYMRMPPVEKQRPIHLFNGREPWWKGPTR